MIRGEFITLARAVKALGIAASGAEAKHLVREGRVKVNGAMESHPGRKLVAGDRIDVEGDEPCIVGREGDGLG